MSELSSLEDGISANTRRHQRYETRSLHSPPGSVDPISDEDKGDSEYDDNEGRSDESEDGRNSETSEKTDDVTYSLRKPRPQKRAFKISGKVKSTCLCSSSGEIASDARPHASSDKTKWTGTRGGTASLKHPSREMKKRNLVELSRLRGGKLPSRNIDNRCLDHIAKLGDKRGSNSYLRKAAGDHGTHDADVNARTANSEQDLEIGAPVMQDNHRAIRLAIQFCNGLDNFNVIARGLSALAKHYVRYGQLPLEPSPLATRVTRSHDKKTTPRETPDSKEGQMLFKLTDRVNEADASHVLASFEWIMTRVHLAIFIANSGKSYGELYKEYNPPMTENVLRRIYSEGSRLLYLAISCSFYILPFNACIPGLKEDLVRDTKNAVSVLGVFLRTVPETSNDAGFLVTTYVIPALTFLTENLDFEIPTFQKRESNGEELYSEKVQVSDIEQCDKEFRDIKLNDIRFPARSSHYQSLIEAGKIHKGKSFSFSPSGNIIKGCLSRPQQITTSCWVEKNYKDVILESITNHKNDYEFTAFLKNDENPGFE